MQYKQYQTASIGISEETVITVPAGKTFVILNTLISNLTDVGTVLATVKINDVVVLNKRSILINDSLGRNNELLKLTLEENDTLKISASVPAGLSATISGILWDN